MQFDEVIGQHAVKQQLKQMLTENRMPHALLFAGHEGCGKLPMALALAQRLLCQKPTAENNACGSCPNCLMVEKLAHPDLHFIFPTIKTKGQSTPAVSDQFLDEWRKQIAESPYFSRQTWLNRINVEKQQSLINVADANNIINKLACVSSQGGYRVVIIWLAEQMNLSCANKLLKILEEPPQQTVFILTADHPERIIPTILSRTQRIDFAPLSIDELKEAIERYNGLESNDALMVARAAAGSYINALEQVTMNAERAQFFDLFVLFMRLCYMRKIKDLYEWAQQLSTWGREKQKAFLEYAQRLVRENFIYNFHNPELNYMNRKESDFAVNFARFINERNVIGITEEIENAQRDIQQNVNANMVFFDFALKMIVLLIQ